MKPTVIAAVLSAGAVLAAPVLTSGAARAQTRIGEVNTAFHVFGDDKIVVERYDDPKVPGAACYISRAVRGGLKGAIGVAEERSRFSVACRATAAALRLPPGLPKQEEVFSASTSFLFKELTVTRMVDADRGMLLYLVTSTRLIDGSPFNSLSAIATERP